MKRTAMLIGLLALAGVIVPPCLFLSGCMELAQVKTWMLVSTIVWFVTVPLWMGRKSA